MEISPQGGYLAKTCPEAIQLNILRPEAPLPTSPFMQMLAEEGIAFEARIFESLRSSVVGAVVVDREQPRESREEETKGAMTDGAVLVIGGRLPIDDAHHRVGEPDLLVRVGEDPKPSGRWAYAAVDVKHHHVFNDVPPADGSLSVEGLWEMDGSDEDGSKRWRGDDLLQLAHYQRMLEAFGYGSPAGPRGGVIGSEARVAWYDLDTPHWRDSGYVEPPPVGPLTTMELYDVEFEHRLAVLRAAHAHMADPTVPLLAEPIRIDACPQCPWRNWCSGHWEETADLSLIMKLSKRRQHQSCGVTDLSGLASLDHRTARLLAGGVDVPDFIKRAGDVDPATPVAQVIPRRRRQVARLVAEGIETAGDADRLCARTLRHHKVALGGLPDQIDQARIRLGQHPAYRRRGAESFDVPRADVEIDVDMENVREGVYLWGALVTEAYRQEVSQEYVPFASWEPDIAVGELDAFSRFWGWLTGRRAEATSEGRTLRAYCYNKGAESTQMRRLSARLGLDDEVDEFLGSDQWVDLLEVVRTHLVVATGRGLKTIAPIAGFHWRSEDVGGDHAMVLYQTAVIDPDRERRTEARRWIVEYNEDDVRATLILREWLDGEARFLPSVADLEPD